jgi:pSer/pThr/pTyr-binding forkhead associated (FHA) protein
MTISRESIADEALSTKPAPPGGPELSSGALLGIKVLASGEVLSLIGRDNYTLGRSIEGQAVIPDIDLSTFEAYDHGISRMHAELRVDEEGVYVVDLESANGTILNGKRIQSQVPQPLGHGDILQLGRMRLQIISHKRG